MFQGYSEPQWKIDERKARIVGTPRTAKPAEVVIVSRMPNLNYELTLEDCLKAEAELDAQRAARVSAAMAVVAGVS